MKLVSESLSEFFQSIKEDTGMVGYGVGTLQTPQQQQILNKLKKKKELDEDNIHPEDKIGRAIAKKMKVPMYFKSTKKGREVHQTLRSK